MCSGNAVEIFWVLHPIWAAGPDASCSVLNHHGFVQSKLTLGSYLTFATIKYTLLQTSHMTLIVTVLTWTYFPFVKYTADSTIDQDNILHYRLSQTDEQAS